MLIYKDKVLNEPGNVDFGSEDISGIGDGTVTGAIRALASKIAGGKGTFSSDKNANGWYYANVNVGFRATSFVVTMGFNSGSLPAIPIQVRQSGNNYEVFAYGAGISDSSYYAGADFNWIAIQ